MSMMWMPRLEKGNLRYHCITLNSNIHVSDTFSQRDQMLITTESSLSNNRSLSSHTGRWTTHKIGKAPYTYARMSGIPWVSSSWRCGNKSCSYASQALRSSSTPSGWRWLKRPLRRIKWFSIACEDDTKMGVEV